MNRLLDRWSIYLPLVLMALLALGSYWLLQATPPAPTQPLALPPPTHEPQSYMRRFSARTHTPDGQLQTELFGEEARHYADDNTTEIDALRLRNFHPDRGTTLASAARAWVNAEQTHYRLSGNVVVTRPATVLADGQALAALEIRGEELQLFQTERRVLSEQPVRMTRGADVFSANRLEHFERERLTLLTGGVRATLMPAPAPVRGAPASAARAPKAASGG